MEYTFGIKFALCHLHIMMWESVMILEYHEFLLVWDIIKNVDNYSEVCAAVMGAFNQEMDHL